MPPCSEFFPPSSMPSSPESEPFTELKLETITKAETAFVTAMLETDQDTTMAELKISLRKLSVVSLKCYNFAIL